MAVPDLVIVPARPDTNAGGPIKFEVRTRDDGQPILPVFSSVAALVRELGRHQPWVCVPWRLAAEAAAQADLGQIVLDPVAGASTQRWNAADLTAFDSQTVTDG